MWDPYQSPLGPYIRSYYKYHASHEARHGLEASLDFGPGHGSFDGTAPSQCSRVDLAAPVEDLSVFDGDRAAVGLGGRVL